MIYTGTFSVAAGVTVEVFTELAIDPLRCSVMLQQGGSGATPVFALCSDGTGANPGPYIGSSGYSNSVAGKPDATHVLYTDKDPVYVKNESGASVNLAVAVYDHP